LGGAFPKLIFFDLDGTLLAPGSVLTDRTLNALHRAIERGAQLALATGGFSHRALRLARAIDDGRRATWTVTHNGAAIWDPDQKLVSHEPMSAEAMGAVLDAAGPRVWCVYEELRGDDATAVYYAGRQRHALRQFVWGPQSPDPRDRPAVLHRLRRAPSRVPDAREAILPGSGRRRRPRPEELERVLGCWLIGTPEALEELDARVHEGELLGARYIHWSQRLAQIFGQPRLRIVGRDVGALGVSKGTAAAQLCARLDIAHAETAAFGDADNDLEMLELAGTAVAMQNATPAVKAVAQVTAPPNTEDGVAAILERWI